MRALHPMGLLFIDLTIFARAFSFGEDVVTLKGITEQETDPAQQENRKQGALRNQQRGPQFSCRNRTALQLLLTR